jgi:hypothetical protein
MEQAPDEDTKWFLGKKLRGWGFRSVFPTGVGGVRMTREQARSATDELPKHEFSLEPRLPYKLVYKTPLCGPCGINEGFGTGTIQKGIYYVDGLFAIQILLGRVCDPLLGGGRYYKPGGLTAKEGLMNQFIR